MGATKGAAGPAAQLLGPTLNKTVDNTAAATQDKRSDRIT